MSAVADVRRDHVAREPRPGLLGERELVLAAQENPLARGELMDAFRPRIASVARVYTRSTAIDRTELMQEGAVGLLRALERYDPTMGTPFWGYAAWWVRQAMQQLVTQMMRPVVLSDRAVRQLARIKITRLQFTQANGREPSHAELAETADLPRDRVDQLIAAERRPRALEEPVNREHGPAASFGDLLADPCAEDAYDGVDLRLQVEELPELLDTLNDRERHIVRGHYGLDGPEQTLRELAGHLGVSAERVRQIEQGALEKLRLAAGS